MLKKVLLTIGVIVAAAAAFIAWKIGPRNIVGMIRYDQRRAGDLRVGDRAPDILLVGLDGKTRQSLLAGAAKPRVLIFGSFT